MKKRHGDDEDGPALGGLATVIGRLQGPADIQAFLEDLCTPAELEAMVDRWRVVPLIAAGVPYREIHDRTAVSVTTIGRVARTLERGAGGYHAALECSRDRVAEDSVT